eukprot:TRINITY_DN25341_c0_g1_i1.p1 TRINITY_DN25341_c0_g1~~TRINITY_DN25341_c0_g1_i1.p1  ORF type:complete len:260 (+),score=47.72 TRINITY_DN25341_c0_g1_i1:272-1051(+)
MMQQPIHLTTPELGRLLVELSMLQSRQTGSQGGSPPGLPPTAVGDIVHMASRPLATGASAGFAPPMKVEMTSLASLRPLCAHALSLGGGDFAFVDTGALEKRPVKGGRQLSPPAAGTKNLSPATADALALAAASMKKQTLEEAEGSDEPAPSPGKKKSKCGSSKRKKKSASDATEPEPPAAAESPNSADGRFQKTELCRFFQANACAKGMDCPFAHGLDELQARPNLYKSAICKMWLRGKCPNSCKTCRFAHGPGDLKH